MRILAFLLLANCALANDTAIHDGGEGPSPIGGTRGPESVIRMVREHLQITVAHEKTEVRATFVFRNTKADASAQQTVGFPDVAGSRASGIDPDDGDFSGPLEGLRTFVDGKERKSRSVRGWVRLRNGVDQPAKAGEKGAFERIWHAVDVEFPVGKEVTIERRYRVPNGSSVAGVPERFFEYTTATGGVWKGTIGELIADVTLKDGITADKLLWSAKYGGMLPKRKSWKVLTPTKLQLVWKDFEPRTEQNRQGFCIAWPSAGL